MAIKSSDHFAFPEVCVSQISFQGPRVVHAADLLTRLHQAVNIITECETCFELEKH